MAKLKEQHCVSCEGEVEALARPAIERLLTEIAGWALLKNNKAITKEFVFKNFDKAMDFVNIVADIAELEGHHPDITISYNVVSLTLTTHAIKGLSENDFVLAAKIDAINL